MMPTKGSRAHASITLFGCWNSLQTTEWGTYWQLGARPEEANQQPYAQEEPPSIGIVCRRICSQPCCADPFETDQLPPSTQVLIPSFQRDYFLLSHLHSVQTEEEDKSYHIARFMKGGLRGLLFCPHCRGLTERNSQKTTTKKPLMKNHLTHVSWAFLSPHSLPSPQDQMVMISPLIIH